MRYVAALALMGFVGPAASGAAEPTDRLVYDEPIFYGTAEFSPELAAHPALAELMRGSAKSLIEQLLDLARREAASAASAGYAFEPYEVIITDEVTLATRRFVSVLRQGYAYTGGTHGNEWTEPVVWDSTRRRVVGIAAFLGDGQRGREGLVFLSGYLRASIADQVWDNQIDPTWVANIDAVTQPDPATLSNFVLLGSTETGRIGGFLFQYDRYAVAPYVLGGAEIVVPQEVLRPYIRPGLLRHFGGVPR